jgi:hypothetical protein
MKQLYLFLVSHHDVSQLIPFVQYFITRTLLWCDGCPIRVIPFTGKREHDTLFHLLQNMTVKNIIDYKTRRVTRFLKHVQNHLLNSIWETRRVTRWLEFLQNVNHLRHDNRTTLDTVFTPSSSKNPWMFFLPVYVQLGWWWPRYKWKGLCVMFYTKDFKIMVGNTANTQSPLNTVSTQWTRLSCSRVGRWILKWIESCRVWIS